MEQRFPEKSFQMYFWLYLQLQLILKNNQNGINIITKNEKDSV